MTVLATSPSTVRKGGRTGGDLLDGLARAI